MSDIGREEILSINQKGWNKVASMFYGGTALPKYGPLAATEDVLNLIPDLRGKRVLEVGCGSGHTLAYLWASKNARELWGLDFAEEQISFAKELLAKKGIFAKLFLSSMDENPGIP
jgi:2-polyprenyl-3-methyl-5-hydroxy-6-metoxy-1,4-benzoquinol methylase